MPKITFQLDERTVTLETAAGQTILDVALCHHLPLEHNCGGNCACTTCHVIVRGGANHLSLMEAEEEDRLDTAEGLTLSSRLGCRAKILGDVVVSIPKNTQPFRIAEPH